MKVCASSARLQDRFAGCLLGLAIGDAVGAPYEGLTGTDIFYRFGAPDRLVTNPDADPLFYTDDTEMMIGVAETLIECGCVVEERLCRAFADNYHLERGYGQGAERIIGRMIHGKDWRRLAETIFPGGSFGNGAAMRVAPIGLLFGDDLDAVWEQARLSPSQRIPTRSGLREHKCSQRRLRSCRERASSTGRRSTGNSSPVL
jgi:poly(ADP-ribose) glycohydrolase ARH3